MKRNWPKQSGQGFRKWSKTQRVGAVGTGGAASTAIGGVTTGRLKQGWAFQFGFIISVIMATKKARGGSWEEIRTVAPKL